MTDLICYAAYPLPFNEELTKLPEYQNTRDFLGAVIGILLALQVQLARHLPTGPIAITWTGDNTSALSWVTHRKAKSAQTQKSFMAYTWICLRREIDIDVAIHAPGTTMGAIDALSRGYSHNLDKALHWTFTNRDTIDALFVYIDPSSRPSHTSTFVHIHALVAAIID
jgi:hypothetical protein